MYHNTLLPVVLYHVRALLCNHDDWSIDVTASYVRHDGSVYNTEALNTMNFEGAVDYSFTWNWSHGACARLVVLGVGLVFYSTLPVVVRVKREVLTTFNWRVVQFQLVVRQCFCSR